MTCHHVVLSIFDSFVSVLPAEQCLDFIMCSTDIISCSRAKNYDVDFSSCTALRDQGHFLQKLVYLDVLQSRMYANYSFLCLYPKFYNI